MIAEYVTTLLVGAASAFLPVTPVELYMITAVATTGDAAWIVGTAVAAARHQCLRAQAEGLVRVVPMIFRRVL
ncbi:hypothetical protein ABZ484_36980 [Streptomyces sp. NPDC006393]|uniref:hypothetical protein n=1 Tax=Streptomyces sp. NPDC006393 TaxID=3156763 RepID=UPI0033FDAEDA